MLLFALSKGSPSKRIEGENPKALNICACPHILWRKSLLQSCASHCRVLKPTGQSCFCLKPSIIHQETSGGPLQWGISSCLTCNSSLNDRTYAKKPPRHSAKQYLGKALYTVWLDSQGHTQAPAQSIWHTDTVHAQQPGSAFAIKCNPCVQGEQGSLQPSRSCRVPGGEAGQPPPAARRMGQEAGRSMGI